MPDEIIASLPGRRGQARRNDALILEAAREVFLSDPKAPVAAVAERAGVGISALYRRYPSKEDLLRRLCHDGLRRFIAEADAAAAEPDAWCALTRFLERVVDADVHSLTVHLAGTFTPTQEMNDDARRAGALAAGLVERAQAAGRCGAMWCPPTSIWCWRGAPRSASPIRPGPANCAAATCVCCSMAWPPALVPRRGRPSPARRRGRS